MNEDNEYYFDRYEEVKSELYLDRATFYLSLKKSYLGSWHFPVLQWNGFDNQYHIWISSLIKGDLGSSLIDGQSAGIKIGNALKWTLVLIGLNIFFSLLISFPLGVYNGLNDNSMIDKWSSGVLFAIYSIPKFWFATVMIIFFTTAEYGEWTKIFPVPGQWYTSGEQQFFEMVSSSLPKFILPVIVLTLPDVAYLARLIRSSIIEEKNRDHIKTALSKGIPRNRITWKHIIPNSLIPTITLLVGVLPAAIASALVVEVIFNIPGIGRLMFDSVHAADWNIVYPILLIISVLVVVLFLLGDLIMAWLNPKINLG